MVIPALNSAETIGYTLSSIFSNKFKPDGFEVIVVDNGSSDNTENIVKAWSEFDGKIITSNINHEKAHVMRRKQ